MDTAKYVWIAELIEGQLVESADEPSAIVLQSGERVQRVRLYGIAVSTNDLVIDDGTGSVLVRFFDQMKNVQVGTPILVIGKPRMHKGEQYVVGEIVKEIDARWLEVVKKLRPLQKSVSATELVRSLDKGDGASYDEVVAGLGKGGEEMIVHLLAKGELFETRPGKLKVLE